MGIFREGSCYVPSTFIGDHKGSKHERGKNVMPGAMQDLGLGMK